VKCIHLVLEPVGRCRRNLVAGSKKYVDAIPAKPNESRDVSAHHMKEDLVHAQLGALEPM
jgi:hypothetical protein